MVLRVQDSLSDLELGMHELRRSCQSALINALSHESFTPLNKILSMTEVIAQKAESLEQCRRMAGLIRDSCERMRFMIQSQIMQYKFECGRLKLNDAPLRLESFD